MRVDEIDRKILAELQQDGRLTVTELADRVRLTPAPCHRRLRELERTGIITGYRAVLDPAAVGLGFEALVSVTMDREDAGTVAAFEAALVAVPEIRHAERLFGDPDYLLRVVATDLNGYATLRDTKLATLPGVHRITSTIVMKRIVDNRPLPLPAPHSRQPRGLLPWLLGPDGDHLLDRLPGDAQFPGEVGLRESLGEQRLHDPAPLPGQFHRPPHRRDGRRPHFLQPRDHLLVLGRLNLFAHVPIMTTPGCQCQPGVVAGRSREGAHVVRFWLCPSPLARSAICATRNCPRSG
jgi:DNA-binding Lrp family transcriptional regulator